MQANEDHAPTAEELMAAAAAAITECDQVIAQATATVAKNKALIVSLSAGIQQAAEEKKQRLESSPEGLAQASRIFSHTSATASTSTPSSSSPWAASTLANVQMLKVRAP